MKKRKRFLYCFLILLLFATNIGWFKLYSREQSKLQNALIPTLANDYFTNQKIITNYILQKENFQVNTLAPILELKIGQKIPYNIYFKTKKEFEHFRKENKNKKDVPLVLQNPLYPNGCEAASAVMLLNSVGIDMTLSNFVEHYLEKDEVYERNGKRYGPDPSKVYAGNPASSNRGWGAFEPVMAKAISNVLKDNKKDTEINLKVSEQEKLPLYYLAIEKFPAVIWVTIDYQKAEDVYNWFSYDKSATYTYPKNSHAVILMGMDEDSYFIQDPLKDEKNISVAKEILEDSYDSMGRQFITFEAFS